MLSFIETEIIDAKNTIYEIQRNMQGLLSVL